MPNDLPATSGRSHEADPRASDPGYIPDEVLETLAPEHRATIKERLANLSRENGRMGKLLERFNQPVAAPAANGNGHAPAKPAENPDDMNTWDDAKIEGAVDKFEQWESIYAQDPENEKAKEVVSNLEVRREINKARKILAGRTGERAAEKRIAPFEAEQAGKREAEQVFGAVFQDLSSRLDGAQRVSALMLQTKDDVDRRLAVLGKTRDTATSHEIALAMSAAIEAAAQNRDGSDGMSHRGRPEIAGEGFGGRARAGSPDEDAEISALLRQKREPEANRKTIHRFLTDPGFVPPAAFVPQTRNDF
jgi:hypothetical protein